MPKIDRPGIVGEPIVGTYWREQYLEVKRQRDEARAENQRLTRALYAIVEADPAWGEYVSLVLSGKLAEAAFDAYDTLPREV